METLGNYLSTLRREAGLSIEDITAKTKIRRGLLEALEQDRHELLPEPVFMRGFIRQYCKVLGHDPEEALSLYDREIELSKPAKYDEKQSVSGLAIKSTASSPKSRLLHLMIIVLLILASISAYLIIGKDKDKKRSVTSVEQTDATSGTTRSFSALGSQ